MTFDAVTDLVSVHTGVCREQRKKKIEKFSLLLLMFSSLHETNFSCLESYIICEFLSVFSFE